MYTLAIDNLVDVPVKFTIKSRATVKQFAFTLTAKKLDEDEIQAYLENKDGKIRDFVTDVVTDWSGQRLVLDDAGEPAAFSPDAFAAMLNVAGVAGVFFSAYLKEVRAKEKN